MKEELLDRLAQELGASLAAMYQAKAEMERLEAENARMREALELLVGNSPDIDFRWRSVARAGLGAGE